MKKVLRRLRLASLETGSLEGLVKAFVIIETESHLHLISQVRDECPSPLISCHFSIPSLTELQSDTVTDHSRCRRHTINARRTLSLPCRTKKATPSPLDPRWRFASDIL